MSKHVLLAAAALSLVVAVRILWGLVDLPPASRANPAQDGSANVDSRTRQQDAQADGAGNAVDATRVAAHEHRVTVVAATTRRPLAQAVFVKLSSTVTDTVVLEDHSVVVACDRQGGVDLHSLHGWSPWMVRASGHCPCIVDDVRPGLVVELDPAAAVALQVTGEDGNPMAGVRIVLQPAIAGVPDARTRPDAKSGVGDPRSPRPVWLETTDGRGMARVDGVPPGSFRLVARHAWAVAASAEAWGKTTIVAPCSLQLSMVDLYGVVAIPPPGRSIRSFSWSQPWALDASAPVLQGADGARALLQERWPDAAVFVSRPSDPSAQVPTVVCRAVLDDDSAAGIEWPIVRIRDLHDPVVLEADRSNVLRAVQVRVVDRSGNPLAMKLRFLSEPAAGMRPHVVEGATDREVMLEVGLHRIVPAAVPSWIREQFLHQVLQIRPTDPMSLENTIVLTRAVRPTVFEIVTEDGKFEGVLHLGIRHASESASFGIMNWEPSRGDIEVLLPPGQIRVGVQSPVWCMPERVVEVEEGPLPLRVRCVVTRQAGASPAGPTPAGPRAPR